MIDFEDNPQLIAGGQAIDNRGSLAFVNDFSLKEFERFYVIQNHEAGFVRAWHGHKIERKAFFVVQGSVQVSCVEVKNFESPARDQEVHSFILDSRLPRVLIVPPGYANGLKSLSSNAIIMVYSSLNIEQSAGDDFRFPHDYWDPWHVTPR